MDLRSKKEIGVIAAMCLVTLLEFFSFATFLPQAAAKPAFAVVLVLLSIVWVSCAAVAFALVGSRSGLAVLLIFPAAVTVIISRLLPVAIGGAILLSIFCLMAQRTLVREVRNRVYYQTSHVFGSGIRLLTLGLMVGLTGLVLPILNATPGSYQLRVTERQIEPLLKPFEAYIGQLLPGFRPDASIDELIDEQIRQQEAQLPEGVELSEQQREVARQQLGRQLQQKLTGQESVATIVANSLNQSVSKITSQNPLLASLILVALVFLTLRALVPFLIWPILGVTAGLIYILRQAGLIYVARTQAMIERLQL